MPKTVRLTEPAYFEGERACGEWLDMDISVSSEQWLGIREMNQRRLFEQRRLKF